MIRSTFAGFNTAVLGLSASQRALDVTGQNLSNINTQGYTRQRLDQISLNPPGPSLANSQYAAKVGRGVMMTGVSQVRDPFLDIQYRSQLPKVGTADAMDAVLAQIGQIFDETDKDAVATQFNAVISQLQSLSKGDNTGTVSSDTVVRSACEVLLNTIRQNGIEIQGVYDELMTKLDKNVIPDINGYLQDIVEKNGAIKNTQVLGNPGLELLDARNEMIDALATYFPIEVTYKKQNLGGGIVVDVLNIDVALADGTKIKLVDDDKFGQVGIAKYQEDIGGHKKGEIVEPVELYFKTAEENPKTYGGGLETLKKELPNEINSYIDDIVELNNAITTMQNKIKDLQAKITQTAGDVADGRAEKINGYIDDISTLNGTIGTAEGVIADLENQIKDSDAALKAKRDEIRAATNDDERKRLGEELRGLQENHTKLQSDLAVKINERNIAEIKRSQALSDLRSYFPADTVVGSIDPNDTSKFMSVSLMVAGDAAANTKDAVVQLVGKDSNGAAVKGTVAAKKPVTTEPAAATEWTVSGQVTQEGQTSAGSRDISASKKINDAVDLAIADMKKQIESFKVQIPRYKEQRQEKVNGLNTYFPDGVTTVPSGTSDTEDVMTNGIMSVEVTLSDGTTKAELVSSQNEAGKVSTVTGTDVSALTMNITNADGTSATGTFEVQGVIDRVMSSVNDRLSEGVLKGDLDMLNKSEIFDADINTTPHTPASDTKGIQFYQKMLDSFINEFASTMNMLNMTEEVPLTDKDGNPVMETVDGKEQQKTVKVINTNAALFTSTSENPEMAPLYKDAEGNWTTSATSKDKDGNIVNNTPVYEPVRDGEGNVKMENGEIVYTTDQAKIPVNFTSQEIKVSDAWMKGDTMINTKRAPIAGNNSTDNWNVNKMIEELSTKTHSFVDPKSGEVFKGTLYECYTNIQDTQAVERKATSQILDTRSKVLDQIADDKDYVSGVWMDEEVMSLMKYSQSYNAASRLMTVMDEVLERLITQTGACGR